MGIIPSFGPGRVCCVCVFRPGFIFSKRGVIKIKKKVSGSGVKAILDLPIEDKIKHKQSLSKDEILSKEGLFLIQCATRDGMTFSDIAKMLGYTPSRFSQLKKEYPELELACKRGKQLVDGRVEDALYRAAVGCKIETVKTVVGMPNKNGIRPVTTERTITERAPNVTACLAWLRNRKPEAWTVADRAESIVMDDGCNDITINIVKGSVKKESETNNGGSAENEEEWY